MNETEQIKAGLRKALKNEYVMYGLAADSMVEKEIEKIMYRKDLYEQIKHSLSPHWTN